MFVPWAVERNQWAEVEYEFMHVMFELCQILDLILPDEPAHPLQSLEVIKSSKSVKDWLKDWLKAERSQVIIHFALPNPVTSFIGS